MPLLSSKRNRKGISAGSRESVYHHALGNLTNSSFSIKGKHQKYPNLRMLQNLFLSIGIVPVIECPNVDFILYRREH